jgi:hypothetical protein
LVKALIVGAIIEELELSLMKPLYEIIFVFGLDISLLFIAHQQLQEGLQGCS